MKYAHIIDGRVVNIILWDGFGRLPIAGPGYLLPAEGVAECQIGGSHDGTAFSPRELTAAEQADAQARAALLMAQEAARNSARAKLQAGPNGLTDDELEALGL